MTKITRDNISTISQRWEKEKSIVVKQSLWEECSKIFFEKNLIKKSERILILVVGNLLLHFWYCGGFQLVLRTWKGIETNCVWYYLWHLSILSFFALSKIYYLSYKCVLDRREMTCSVGFSSASKLNIYGTFWKKLHTIMKLKLEF